MRPTEAEQSMCVHNVAMTYILARLICMKVRPYTFMPNIRGVDPCTKCTEAPHACQVGRCNLTVVIFLILIHPDDM